MQTIGDRLEEARKKKGISIREAAEATKIRGDYLTKFEGNQFDIGLTDIYVRGFLRSYAIFLKLPPDRILNDFSALGHDAPKPRQPGREVYGRMDLSIASADAREEQPPPPPAATAPHAHRSPHVPRSGGVSHGTALDPAVVFKIGKWAGAAVVLGLIVWAGFALFGGAKPAADRATKTAPATQSPVVQPAAEPTLTLYALDTVRVKVVQEIDGKELFQGTLARGESRAFPKHGAILVTASMGENLEVEVYGKRYPMPFKGWDRAKIN